ncbi:MAG: hypothetical protein QXY10_01490 [Candidatus Micrarchaeaceae archaeon]
MAEAKAESKSQSDKAFKVVSFLLLILALLLAALMLILAGNKYSTSTPVQIEKNIVSIKNLTSEYIKNSNASYTAIINMPKNVSIHLSTNNASLGTKVNITIYYYGTFGFLKYNSSAYLKSIENIYYFTFHTLGGATLLYGMQNASNYFQLIKNKTEVTNPPNMNPYEYMQADFTIVPMPAASNKTWYFCGGIFITFLNGTYAGKLNYLAHNNTHAYNESVINLISNNCSALFVS